MSVDPEQLRHVMRHWATGVAVLSSRHAGEAHGMTVNAFTSVSLSPPLVLASLEQGVRTHRLVAASGIFAVSFLRSEQAWISDRFAGRETEHEDRFAGLETRAALTGAPILAGNLGWLDCRVVAAHPAGDHTVFIAEVVAAEGGPPAESAAAAPGNGAHPLLYFNRSYHELCG